MGSKKVIDYNLCVGCSACTFVCPIQCIKMIPDDEGFLHPNIDIEKCVDCGQCRRVCPVYNHPIDDNKKPIAYAFKHNDDSVRLSSSSGGAFTALAISIIRCGGVVFGAAFADDHMVKHICCETIEQLVLLRGSKYVQSDISECFQAVKEQLERGREVLFSGTPCQIAAVTSAFGEKYPNLTTVDLICHGVPSPLVWANYISEREKKAGGKTKEVQFRYKNPGWKKYSVKYDFDNGDEYIRTVSEDPYMKAFLGHVMLRESCYTCQFRGTNRQSDITLADFWGVEKVVPEYNDDKGTSLILLNSPKGAELVRNISQNGKLKEVNFESATAFNSSYFKSAEKSSYSDAFQRALIKHGMDYAVNKYLGSSFVSKVRRCYWKMISTL